MRNAPIKQNIPRQQFQPKGPVQNYQQEEENEEIEGDEQEQEQEGIEEDAFAGGGLREGPFFGRKTLRRIGFVNMVEIIDAACADGIIRMGFHEVELLLKFVRAAPEVVAFAHRDILSSRPRNIKNAADVGDPL